VNHLNRAVKAFNSNTTTQVIAERVLQESKVLLKQINWNIGEIAYAMGFTEVTHFKKLFKMHQEINPSSLRKLI
jgi:AraC family transcriptional activator of pobA